jgi:ZIP family zinc transporter
VAIALGALLDGVPEGVVLGVSVLHHGAILALVSETMIPEAFHGSPQFNGLVLVIGFVVLLILLVLSH